MLWPVTEKGCTITIVQVFLTLLMLVLLSASPVSGKDHNSEWEKITESDGIIVYARTTSKSSVYEIRAMGIVNAPVAVLEAVIRDDDAKIEYGERGTEAFRVDIPALESSKDTYYIYIKIGMPWPFYDRDGVARVRYMIDQATGALLVQVQNISTDFKREDHFVLRVPIAEAKWILTPLGENKTEMVYQILVDPGGYIPAFLVNMYSKDMAIKTIEDIRKFVRTDRYKNAKSVLTTTPWDRD